MVSVKASFRGCGAGTLALVSLTMLAACIALPARAQMFRMDVIPKIAEPFGRAAGLAPAGPLWIKWREMDEGLAKAEQALARCRGGADDCPPSLAPLAALVSAAAVLYGRQRLATVNRAVNLAIAYTGDDRRFGDNADVWSDPAATFASGRGDCEDYAIAKLFALRAAGVPPEDLRLVVVRLTASGEGHAMLAARADGDWLLLDNRTLRLVRDTEEPGVMPLFALDAGGVRQYGAVETTVTAAARLPSPAEIYPYDPLWLAM